jgi:hypothetical protein
VQDALAAHAAVKDEFFRKLLGGANEAVDPFITNPRPDRVEAQQNSFDQIIGHFQQVRMILKPGS